MVVKDTITDSVGYEHRSLENSLGSLENLPARARNARKKFRSVFARLGMCSKKVALELARLEFFMLEMLEHSV